MRFLLFLLLNAVMFLRPEELLADSAVDEANGGAYQWIMLLCLGLSIPLLVERFSIQSLYMSPISICVIGLQAIVCISAFLNVDPRTAFSSGIVFLKLLLYFFLLISVVDTPKKLIWFVRSICIFISVIAVLTLLDYHHIVDIDAIAPYAERQWEDYDPDAADIADGGPVVLERIRAVGIFNNPNDLARILVFGSVIALFLWCERRTLISGLPWLIMLGVFVYALMLTYSRGGLLSFLASLAVTLGIRYGGKNAIRLGILLAPVLLGIFAGRQTNMNTTGGTGHQRIEIWFDAFMLLKSKPAFGLGMDQLQAEIGIAAHNSFIHAYAELGFVGGTFFVAAFYFALAQPYQIELSGSGQRTEDLSRFRPYLLGIIAGTIIAMLSSSRNFVVLTYLLLGLSASYVRLARERIPFASLEFNRPLVLKVIMISVATLLAHYAFVLVSLARA